MTKLYDNSRVSDHALCNRLYYWRHIRDITSIGTNVNLVFGSAWHEAMDTIWNAISKMPNLTDDEVAEIAFQSFLECWMGYGLPHADDIPDDDWSYKVKNPNNAYFMIKGYINKRRNFIEGIKLLETEKPFAVPIDISDKETFYVGRLDKIIEWNGRVWVVEHKTTGWGTIKSGINRTYADSWSPNTQIDGYMHAAYMEYGKKFKGVLVDIALCLNNSYDHFEFIPVDRTINQLDAWLWELKREISILELNKKDLEDVKPDDPFMKAFPKRTKSCIQFMRPCLYLDLCKAIANPHEDLDRDFKGFKKEHWSPFNEINLEKVGIREEDK